MRLSPNYHKSVLIGVLVISTIFWVIVAAYQIRGQFPHGEIAFDLRSMLGRPSAARRDGGKGGAVCQLGSRCALALSIETGACRCHSRAPGPVITR